MGRVGLRGNDASDSGVQVLIREVDVEIPIQSDAQSLLEPDKCVDEVDDLLMCDARS